MERESKKTILDLTNWNLGVYDICSLCACCHWLWQHSLNILHQQKGSILKNYKWCRSRLTADSGCKIFVSLFGGKADTSLAYLRTSLLAKRYHLLNHVKPEKLPQLYLLPKSTHNTYLSDHCVDGKRWRDGSKGLGLDNVLLFQIKSLWPKRIPIAPKTISVLTLDVLLLVVDNDCERFFCHSHLLELEACLSSVPSIPPGYGPWRFH